MVINEGNESNVHDLPDVHIAVVGIEKVIPDWESLTVFLKLLFARQRAEAHGLYIIHHRTAGRRGGLHQEVHLVLLDNGRSRILHDLSAAGIEVYPLRSVPECLPGLQERRRFRLWVVHPDRSARYCSRKCLAPGRLASCRMRLRSAVRVLRPALSAILIPTIPTSSAHRVAGETRTVWPALPGRCASAGARLRSR
jgi:hypothetical protein